MLFYLINGLFFFYHFGIYAYFRFGIFYYLRSTQISRSSIRISITGFLNFWFYRAFSRKYGFRRIYICNMAYLVLLLALMLAWLPLMIIANRVTDILGMRIVIVVLQAVLAFLQIPIIAFSFMQSNRVEFGTEFVFWAQRESGRYHSSIVDILSCLIPLLLLGINIKLLFF